MVPRDVFISYKNEDRQGAESICTALESESISCWMAPRDIAAGQEWAVAIVEALHSSKAFVVVLSSNSRNARQIAREAELADRQRLPMIAFRLEDVEPPPELLYFVGNVQWLDGFGGQFDSAVKKLAEFIRRHGGDKKSQHAYATGSAAAIPRPISAAPNNPAPSVAPSDIAASRSSTGGPVRAGLRFGPESLEQLAGELAPYVGPMAKVLVKRAAKQATSWKQLYDALATEIPDGPERRKFLSKRPV
jgi:hypothetical protein